MTSPKTNIKSAFVSFGISGILAGAMYVLQVGDIFALDIHKLINVVAIAVLVAIVSLIKSGGTDPKGKFAGVKIR